MSKSKNKRWLSDREACDLCGKDISADKVDYFVDGKVKKLHVWALMCPNCFAENGVGLGLGLGQMYSGDKKARKIAG